LSYGNVFKHELLFNKLLNTTNSVLINNLYNML